MRSCVAARDTTNNPCGQLAVAHVLIRQSHRRMAYAPICVGHLMEHCAALHRGGIRLAGAK